MIYLQVCHDDLQICLNLWASSIVTMIVLIVSPAGRPDRSFTYVIATALAAAFIMDSSAVASNSALLGGAVILAVPQLARKQFKALLGDEISSDVRRGGGPTFLFLAISSATLESGHTSQFGLSFDQELGWICAILAIAATVMAPDQNWPPTPLQGPRMHAIFQTVVTLLIIISFALQINPLDEWASWDSTNEPKGKWLYTVHFEWWCVVHKYIYIAILNVVIYTKQIYSSFIPVLLRQQIDPDSNEIKW